MRYARRRCVVESLESRRLLAAIVGRNFEVLDRGFSGFIPPDTMGAVGDTHVVQLINGAYGVYTRDGVLQRARSLDAFWNEAGVFVQSFSFDPRIVYDNTVDRFYALSVDNGGADNAFLFAVSLTSNPLDGWAGFRIDSDPQSGERWADFPQMGFSNDAVYVTANMFPIAGSPVGTQVNVLVLPKVDLLAPTPGTARRTLFDDQLNLVGFSAQPVVFGQGANLPGMLVSGSGTQLRFTRVTGTALAPTLTAAGIVTPGGSAPPLGRQPDGSRDLSTGGDRISTSVVFASDEYHIVRSTEGPAAGSNAAIRYSRVNASIGLVGSIVIEDPSLDLSFPSIAVNESGQFAIGFSGSGPARFASAFAVTGTNIGLLTSVSPITLLREGQSNYRVLDNIGRNRWGDYSHTVVDPLFSDRFWTFQEWAETSTQWSINATELLLTADSIPPTPSAPTLLSSSDTGASNSDNITKDNRPQFVGTAQPLTTVNLVAGTTLLGSGSADAAGAWSIQVGFALADGVFDVVAVGTSSGGSSDPSAPLRVTIDTQAPVAIASSFLFETAPHRFVFDFAEPLTLLATPAPVTVRSLTTNQNLHGEAFVTSAQANGAQITFSGLPNQIVPDGRYDITLGANAFADLAGNVNAPQASSFRFLNADANRSGGVDFADLLILSQNYGQSGRTFSTGNFTYDPAGTVGFDDLLILSQKFGSTVLVEPPANRSIQSRFQSHRLIEI
jgi:hypothetical protein